MSTTKSHHCKMWSTKRKGSGPMLRPEVIARVHKVSHNVQTGAIRNGAPLAFSALEVAMKADEVTMEGIRNPSLSSPEVWFMPSPCLAVKCISVKLNVVRAIA